MVERHHFDRPALAIAAVLGVAVIGLSLPFTVAAFCHQNGCGAPPAVQGPFDVAWSEAPSGQGAADLQGLATRTIAVNVTLAPVSTLAVTVTACTDTYDARLGQNPASVHWTLKEGTATLKEGTFSCSPAPAPLQFVLHNVTRHPDLGRLVAHDLEEASSRVAANVTDTRSATYSLAIQVTRAPGPVEPPVPLPGGVAKTDFQGAMALQIQQWMATVTPHPPEVMVR